MKYSFLMPYHMRAEQLQVTLESFLRFYRERNDYEVLVGEDVKNVINKEEHLALGRVIDSFKNKMLLHVIPVGGLDIFNPSIAFNILASKAGGKYFVITNPECYHTANLLSEFDKIYAKEEQPYIICACRTSDGRWYQHSQIRSVKLHFCSVISNVDYDMIGGFDEGYSRGMCFEDDDFRLSIEKQGISIIERDDLLVIHQTHTKSKPKNYLYLYKINKAYFQNKWGEQTFRAEQIKV